MTEDSLPAERLDRKVFTIAIAVLAAFSLAMVLFPDGSRLSANAALSWLTNRLGWFYLMAGMAPLVMASWLAFGRYGDVLLGPEGEPPEYSTPSWIAMMFTASMGAGLIAWGFAEPIFYLETPPFGIEPHSDLAYEFAHMYPIYHWGIVPWAIYCLPAIPIAYMLFVDNRQSLKISDACDHVLPERGRSLYRTVIDIFVVLGVVGGVATSLGFGVPLSASLASQLLGVPDNFITQGAVILVMTAVFGTSAYRGLKRGIKILADLNLWLMYFVMAFVLLLGPTIYTLSLSMNSVGLMLDNFFRISFWTDPVSKSGFPEAWTVFYWAWWLAYAPMMGLFFGRISKGRTIRQVVLGIIGFGALGTFLFLSIAGALVLHLQSSGLLDAAAIINEQGMGPLVAQVIAELPFKELILSVVAVLSIIFYATTFDSAAYVLASICTHDLAPHREPAAGIRLIWALGLGLTAVGLMMVNAMDTVKSMSVVSSLPVIPILVLMCFGLYRSLNDRH